MAVEYEISSDVATIKGVAPNTQVARVVSLYSGQITYDDEAGSKFATATIDGKSQRVMLCIAVNGTVNYDDVPCLYSTVDGHRCLNIVAPTETGTPDDVPSVYETVVIDGKNVRAVRCVLINATPIYDGVSSTCTFVENGKTHTAQLVNKVVGGSVEVIVRGTSPISLPDAIADSLAYLKAFGGTEQRNLPDGYTQLEYIDNNGTAWLDLGMPIGSSDIITFDMKWNEMRTATFFGAYNADGSYSSNSFVGTYCSDTDTFCFYANSAVTAGSATKPTTRSTLKWNGINANPTLNGTAISNKAPFNDFTPSVNAYLFVRNQGGTAGTVDDITLYSFKVERNGNTIMNLIPAKRTSDNAIGMYDTVSGQFFTNAGTDTFVAGPDAVPSPDSPMDIVSNNGVLKANLNLYWTEYHGYQLSQVDGITLSTNASVNVSGAVDCRTIKSFVVTNASLTGSFRVFKYAPDGTFMNATITGKIGDTITLDSTVGYFRIQYNFTSSGTKTENILIYNSAYSLNAIYADGTVETIEDTIGNTATAEMLLKVGDYQDVQEILSGVVTRNVGVKVLDGTEEWVMGGTYNQFYTDNTITDRLLREPGICSHYVYTTNTADLQTEDNVMFLGVNTQRINFSKGAFDTLDSFKQYLADQYAAGTPVIVIYPLATATTESVAGQALNVQQGDNFVEITQAAIDNLELEAKYQAAVSLTIQEVQDANLDPNVQVTIN